ncbi:MAG: hypothetical protein GC160_16950 [Acidobacteria bacterium]|nr:hypothetical protein [Acidobacteriota bacterium]
MRKTSLARLLLAGLCCVAGLSAATKEEIAEVDKLLRDGSDRFLALVKDLSPEQWNAKVPLIQHSIGEEAEHIALSENELQQVVLQAMQAAPAPGAAERLKGKQAKLKEVMLGKDAAENFQSPNKIANKAELLEYFPLVHKKLIAMWDSTKEREMDEHVYVHPLPKVGELNALQWFYYIALHRERHIRQIEAIKSHPDFPGQTQSAD